MNRRASICKRVLPAPPHIIEFSTAPVHSSLPCEEMDYNTGSSYTSGSSQQFNVVGAGAASGNPCHFQQESNTPSTSSVATTSGSSNYALLHHHHSLLYEDPTAGSSPPPSSPSLSVAAASLYGAAAHHHQRYGGSATGLSSLLGSGKMMTMSNSGPTSNNNSNALASAISLFGSAGSYQQDSNGFGSTSSGLSIPSVTSAASIRTSTAPSYGHQGSFFSSNGLHFQGILCFTIYKGL